MVHLRYLRQDAVEVKRLAPHRWDFGQALGSTSVLCIDSSDPKRLKEPSNTVIEVHCLSSYGFAPSTHLNLHKLYSKP